MPTTTQPPQSAHRQSGPSITTLMAWLSVCLLAAAWGPELSHGNRLAWSSFGLLGLVAALGLDVIARVRRARQEQTQQNTVAVVHQQRLGKIERHTRSAQAARDAIRWVAEMAQRYRNVGVEALGPASPNSDREQMGRRSEERTACWMPVDLIPGIHESDDETLSDSPVRVAAFVENVSSTGIRLCHSEPVETVEAVLQVRPEDVEGVALLLTHCWTRPTNDGWFQSGWKLLNVLREAEEENEAELLSVAY